MRTKYTCALCVPSVVITVCYHLASLVMSNGDPREGPFDPSLAHMIDSYNMRACACLLTYMDVSIAVLPYNDKNVCAEKGMVLSNGKGCSADYDCWPGVCGGSICCEY